MTTPESKSASAECDKTAVLVDIESLKADLARVRTDVASISAALLACGKNAIEGAGSDVGQYAQHSVKQVQDLIRDRPASSALMAMGVGVCVGILLRKR